MFGGVVGVLGGGGGVGANGPKFVSIL